MLTTLLGTKLAIAVAAGATGLGGLAAAAYAGALPESVQDFAHHTIAAPAANRQSPTSSDQPTSSATPVGPDATGHAAFGLCTAYAHAKAHGDAASASIAFRNLATAAGGADQIGAYCATVARPGSSAAETHPTGHANSHPTGKPTALPTTAASHAPSGVPATHPTGAPANHPTGRP
jgi:hypothetical protein